MKHGPSIGHSAALKVLVVLGTRPEAIKMAPIIKAMRQRPESFECRLCVTGQHRQMLDDVLKVFEIRVDHDLDIMKDGQTLSEVTAKVFLRLDPVVVAERPDWLLVQGDTTTAMAASLVAYYHKVLIGHVEAGLRTYDKFEPFPEEINRRITTLVADLHFAPTPAAQAHLLDEDVPADRIHVTGNPVIDALLEVARQPCPLGGIFSEPTWDGQRMLLVTAHRRESFGRPLQDICRALKTIAESYARSAVIVYPVHPNPNVSGPVHQMLQGIPNILLLEPLDYRSLVHVMNRSYLVLTDSGGIQEEAPSLGKPVLVLRNTTERPEAVSAGATIIAGTRSEDIVHHVKTLMEDAVLYESMATAGNPYGDGHAAERICGILCAHTRSSMDRPIAQSSYAAQHAAAQVLQKVAAREPAR
jgi:UDP-N-acetylglucosamine 2-epimerase (non-hydrolysing)